MIKNSMGNQRNSVPKDDFLIYRFSIYRRKRDRLGKDVGAFIFPYCSRSPDRVSSKFYLFCKGRISLFKN